MAEAGQTRTEEEQQELLNARLWTACHQGNNSVVEQCLSDGADLKYERIGATCIGNSAQYGHVHTLLLLINRGADIHQIDSEVCWNPMHRACVGRQLEVIQLLRQHGLDLHTPKDKGGYTPIDVLKNTSYDNNNDRRSRRIECLKALQVNNSDTDINSKDNAEYVKAMAEGGGNLEHLNIVLHGPPGSGKSSLKRAILGEDPLPQVEQNSTNIMEITVRAVSMDRMKNFKVIKNKDLLNLLAEAILNQIKKVEESKSTAANSGYKPPVIPNTMHGGHNIGSTNTSANIDFPSTNSESVVSPTLSIIKEKLKSAKLSSDLFNSAWYHLIDSGGQSQYQDIFPLLYNTSSFQILVMRLTDGLDKKIPNCYTVEGKNALKYHQRLQLTNRQYIEKMCQIAASSSPPSRVMIVGTHKDKLGDNAEAKIEELNRELEDIQKKYVEVVICKSDDEIIFDINTMAEGKDREEYTRTLQQKIKEVSNILATSTTVPLQWLAFQLDISNDSGVVKMEDCYKSGRAFGMGVAAIKSALVYFNKAALLLYYPDHIPDIVLTSVNPLVSKLSQLVKASFITPNQTLRAECETLRNKGIFNRVFLDKVIGGTSTDLSNELFLKLLLCLRIADYIRNDEYFLPSALSLDNPCLNVASEDTNHVPFGFTFENRILPHGFFFTFAIAFLGTTFSDYVFKLCDKLHQCRHELFFQEKNCRIPGTVTLTNRNTWIQVSTTSPVEYCPIIFKTIEIAIHKAIARFKLTITLDSPSVVSLCPVHPNSDHYCILSSDKMYFTCSEVPTIFRPVKPPNMLYWISENQPTVSAVDVTSQLVSTVDNSNLSGSNDLVHVLEAIISVNDWHSLGLALGMEKYWLDMIEIDHRTVMDFRKAMISRWMDTGDASWSGIVRALSSPLVGKKGLARRIADQHSVL